MKRIRQRKGSSTVLVILMIVLLVSLSVLSVSVSNSGYRLSKRMGQQFQEYYLLESEADRCYSGLMRAGSDKITIEAMKELGCLDAKIEEGVCSFRVERSGRSFIVSFELSTFRRTDWYEREKIFEVKPLEISTFD
ncbi:MAG: hypothetical protein Q4A41_00735 [Bacillota bacterium]|nr:hypothetical protein [Bacillota bacterium]